MIFELTLLSSFVAVHLVVGLCLILALSLAVKIFALSSELQSWLWATAFVVTTLLPFMTFVQAPVSGVIVEQHVADSEAGLLVPVSRVLASERAGKNLKSADNEWNVSALVIYKMINGLYLFLIVWALGSAWRAVSVSRSVYRTGRLISSATPMAAKHKMPGMNAFPILTTPMASTPMAVGLISPVILLPQFLVEHFDSDRLAPIVLHELAHIERRDLWLGLFQETLAIVFWWSPVTRVINHKIHITRELACDIRAAKRLSSGKRYAQALLDCAELMLIQRSNVLAMGLFSKKKELTRRVNEVLKFNDRKVPKTLGIAFICASVTISTMAIANAYAPKININTVKTSANHFSELSEQESASLRLAIQSDDWDLLATLVGGGLDINKALEDEATALIYAAKTGRLEMVEKLIDLGADVNQSALGDGNPLIAAAGSGNLDLANVLITSGADVNSHVRGDGTPLLVAIQNNDIEMARLLIDAGADIHTKVKGDGTALIKAASVGSIALTSLLVELGADVNEFLLGEETPLINAAQNNASEVAEYLIANGADVNLAVKTGDMAPYDVYRSPLSEAKKHQHQAMIELLQVHGAIDAAVK